MRVASLHTKATGMTEALDAYSRFISPRASGATDWCLRSLGTKSQYSCTPPAKEYDVLSRLVEKKGAVLIIPARSIIKSILRVFRSNFRAGGRLCEPFNKILDLIHNDERIADEILKRTTKGIKLESLLSLTDGRGLSWKQFEKITNMKYNRSWGVYLVGFGWEKKAMQHVGYRRPPTYSTQRVDAIYIGKFTSQQGMLTLVTFFELKMLRIYSLTAFRCTN